MLLLLMEIAGWENDFTQRMLLVQTGPASFKPSICYIELIVLLSARVKPNIAMFNKLMRPCNRYYMSNALTKEANPYFQISDYGHSWTLSGLTHVELLEDSVPYTIPCNFNFTRLYELHSKIERDEPIAIRCLIVHSIPIGNQGKCADYVVIDEEGIPMMIRVWGGFVDNGQNHVTASLPAPTMVVFINVRVTTHHGLSLATKTNSSVFHNPPIANAAALLEWFDKNSDAVCNLLREEAYKNADVLLHAPSPDMNMYVVVPLDAGQNVPTTTAQEGSSSNTDASAQLIAAEQLFSPTTKRILDEIGVASSRDQPSSALSVTVKRSIFEVKESESCTESSVKAVGASCSSNVGAAVVEGSVQDATKVDPVMTRLEKRAKTGKLFLRLKAQ